MIKNYFKIKYGKKEKKNNGKQDNAGCYYAKIKLIINIDNTMMYY